MITKLKLPLHYSNIGDIYLTDIPGFYDSRGENYEIANSLSTFKILSSANSIRFILVIN